MMELKTKNKKSNLKKILLGSFLGILIGSLLGTTYAMFTYNSSSINSKLISGDIYMRYKETSGLDISGAMPSSTYDNTKYFEFDIVGKNTSERDIWYEIVLTDGDKPNNRNTKLGDKFLKFTLYKGNDLVIDGASFEDITNQRLYTGAIEKETNIDTKTTYKLYMWIDNGVVIGNNNQDYTLQEWNDIYASVKVNVNARTETNHSCFTLSDKDETNHTATISAYDATCGGKDIIIPKTIDGYAINAIGTNAFSMKSLVNVLLPNTIKEIGYSAFRYNNLSNIILPSNIEKIDEYAFDSTQISNTLIIPENISIIGKESFSRNFIKKVVINGSNLTNIGNQAFAYNEMEELVLNNSSNNLSFGQNIFSSLNTVNINVLNIPDSSFSNLGITKVVLGSNVRKIGNSAFSMNRITSLSFLPGVTQIEDSAFKYNNLSGNIIIPNTVNVIACNAFDYNNDVQVLYENSSLTCTN